MTRPNTADPTPVSADGGAPDDDHEGDDATRPLIHVDGGDLHIWADDSWRAVIDANDEHEPTALLHGDDPVRLDREGRLKPYNKHSLRDRLSRVARFGKHTDDGTIRLPPPVAVAENLLARGADEYAADSPRIDRIVDVPIVTAEGAILDRPGHHADNRIYYRPARGLEELHIPGPGEVELVDQVVEARDFLMVEWLGDFGFADQASRANALAMLLTPLLRDYIPGGTPLFPIIAPQWGWGKGLLTDVCLTPGCGVVAKGPSTDNEEEMRKRLTSSLREVPEAIVIDNQTGHLDSGKLAAALTTGVWKDRILGESRDLVVPVRCLFSVNGNNFTMSGELIERSPAPVTLGPGAYWEHLCERKGWDPALRPRERPRHQFTHGDLLAWAQKNRAAAVEAAFVLIRHWLDGYACMTHGGHVFYRPAFDEELPEEERWSAPERPDRDTGEFVEWQRVVGGVLKAAGVSGFRDNYDAWSTTTDEEAEEIINFLSAWHALGREPMEFRGVLGLCQPLAELHERLPTDLASTRSDQLHGKLKAWLRDHKDQRFGGYRLIRQEGQPRLWEVLGG